MVEGGFDHRHPSWRGSIVVLVLGLAALTLTGAVSASGGGGNGALRLVGPSVDGPSRALALSAAPSRSDPWRPYLAGEAVCPGGDRIDLPEARKIATVACLINFARKRHGLRGLSIHAVLSRASAAKATAIVRCQRFAHNPCGGDWTSSVRARGYRGAFGENLYLASGRWGAPRAVVDAWLNSAPHRETLFGLAWKEQGLAVLSNERFDGYRDVSLWVSVLGA